MFLLHAITNDDNIEKCSKLIGSLDKNETAFELGTWGLDIIYDLGKLSKSFIPSVYPAWFENGEQDKCRSHCILNGFYVYRIQESERIKIKNYLSKIIRKIVILNNKKNPLGLNKKEHYDKLLKIFSNYNVVIICK